MKIPNELRSTRFTSKKHVIDYFKDAQESPLIDAIMYLASEIERLEYAHELLDNEYREYDP